MRRTRSTLLVVALAVCAGLGAFACASKERKAASATRPDGAEARAAVDEGAEASSAAEQPPEPVDPFAGITGDASVGFEGDDRLLVEALADLEVPSFDVACLSGEGALATPADLDERLGELASTQDVPVGRVRFVRIESDPSRAGRGASARLCRPVREDAVLYAPLFRVKEPAALWLVERSSDVPAAVRTLVERAAQQGAKAAGPPRAVVVRGKVVAVALPVLSG